MSRDIAEARKKGFFITLEGGEGAGKTTQIKHIGMILEEWGVKTRITREPGGTDIGAKIRSILLNPENKALLPTAELLLYMADRAQHLGEKVLPLLDQGVTVISDRYFESTMVYQGYARGLDKTLIYDLHAAMVRGVLQNRMPEKCAISDTPLFFEPDLTFVLDLDPETGLSRTFRDVADGSRKTDETRFEREALAFHETIRKGYLDLARKNPARFRVIDASQDKTAVMKEIVSHLNALISGKTG